MLIVIIALRSLWQVWSSRRRQRLARKYLHQLTDLSFGDGAGSAELSAPFWRAVLMRYRKNASAVEARRLRSRKAMRRLSRMASAR